MYEIWNKSRPRHCRTLPNTNPRYLLIWPHIDLSIFKLEKIERQKYYQLSIGSLFKNAFFYYLLWPRYCLLPLQTSLQCPQTELKLPLPPSWIAPRSSALVLALAYLTEVPTCVVNTFGLGQICSCWGQPFLVIKICFVSMVRSVMVRGSFLNYPTWESGSTKHHDNNQIQGWLCNCRLGIYSLVWINGDWPIIFHANIWRTYTSCCHSCSSNFSFFISIFILVMILHNYLFSDHKHDSTQFGVPHFFSTDAVDNPQGCLSMM